jgi:uncharacterized protein
MVIDAHVHLYPLELNRDPLIWGATQAETHWAMLCTRRRKDGRRVQGFPGIDDLLRAMDAAGVGRAVLLGWYWQWPETCVWQNRFYAECVQAHPDRLSAFATLHPSAGRDATLAEVQRARDAGLIGLGELSPHSQGYDVANPVLGEALELAAELRMPVNLHVTDHESGHYPGRVETPLRDFVWLAHTFPRTNFILSHWGGRMPLHDEEAEDLLNVFYDTAASPLLYDASIWQKFLEVVPPERVLFGSDYPLNLYPKLDDEPGLARLVAEAKAHGADAALLGGNAKRLLHL